MEAYGFADWDGNDRHFMGWAGTGVHFDPVIASNAAHWLSENAGPDNADDRAVVPDRGPGQPPRRHVVPRRPARLRGARTPRRSPASARCSSPPRGRTTRRCPSTGSPTPRCATPCRPTSATRCTPSPRPTASGAGTSSTASGATSTRPTRRPGCATSTTTSTSTSWPTGASAPCSAPSRRPAAWDDTIIIFTSDHGDMCGSHGLRSKGPFVYDEIMRVPLYVKVPGTTAPGTVTLGPRLPRRPGRHHLLAGRRRPGDRRRPPCRART